MPGFVHAKTGLTLPTERPQAERIRKQMVHLANLPIALSSLLPGAKLPYKNQKSVPAGGSAPVLKGKSGDFRQVSGFFGIP